MFSLLNFHFAFAPFNRHVYIIYRDNFPYIHLQKFNNTSSRISIPRMKMENLMAWKYCNYGWIWAENLWKFIARSWELILYLILDSTLSVLECFMESMTFLGEGGRHRILLEFWNFNCIEVVRPLYRWIIAVWISFIIWFLWDSVSPDRNMFYEFPWFLIEFYGFMDFGAVRKSLLMNSFYYYIFFERGTLHKNFYGFPSPKICYYQVIYSVTSNLIRLKCYTYTTHTI